MKKTNILIRSISFLLSFLLIFTLPHTSMHGANDEMSADDSYEIMPLSVISWSSMKSISTTNVKYYKISDMTSCGENLTNDATKDIKYDSLMRSDTTRLTYQKKLPISQGTKVNLLATKSDTGKGGANLTDDEKVYWNVLEFDKNGYCLYDSGWLDMEDTWTAGKTKGGTSMNTSKKRSTVKYLIFLFRFATGDLSNAAPSKTITASSLNKIFPNIYICFSDFTYTIDYNGGKANNKTSLTVTRTGLSKVNKLLEPARTGYTFKGYTVDSSSSLDKNWMDGNTYSLSKINGYLTNGYFYNSLFGDVTFKAKWEANDYTVEFNANGGSVSPTSMTVTYDATYSTLPTPSRDGHSFVGWFTSLDNENEITSTTKVNITSTQTLYAKWTAIPYQISYDANGGTISTENKTYYYGDEVDLSPTANKPGYTFVGWTVSPNDKMALGSYKMPAENITLYALYTIDVSDVANHTYPEYNKTKDLEVYAAIKKSDGTHQTFPLTYTKDIARMTYQYLLNHTNISSFVGNNSYEWSIIAFDNAGNYSSIGSPPPPPVEHFDQVVQHWTLNLANQKINNFYTTQESIKKGLTYTPPAAANAIIPAGYQFSSIDNAYTVTGNKVSFAYYTPKNYTLTFHPQGGNVSPSSKNVTYHEFYGHMPTPAKTGHRFKGWFTAPNGGEEKTSADTYLITGDSTLYAHWETNSYNVTYDYKTNGGESASKAAATVFYGSNIDLSVTASKSGWTFVGWNTNPNATTKLSSLSMAEDDIVLYAIYKKDLTATFIDGTDKQTTKITKTIFNRETSSNITIPSLTVITGWNPRGWSFQTDGAAGIHVSAGSTYVLDTNQTFYGCYVQDITICYDTNGSSQTIEPQTKERYYNAFGTYSNPVFITANAPILDEHSFVYWECLENNGNSQPIFSAGINLTADQSMTLTAKWDAYPEIEAYDRYFRLEEAIQGKITTARLLEKVTATDKEDGTLVNENAVIVKDYHTAIFTNLSTSTNITITYKATDSFGNISEKNVTIYVVDTTVALSPKRYYARFIHPDFYKSNGHFIPHNAGGLEATSIWQTDDAYQRLLDHTIQAKTPTNTFTFSKEELSQLKELH